MKAALRDILLTKLARSAWLDISLFLSFFCESTDEPHSSRCQDTHKKTWTISANCNNNPILRGEKLQVCCCLLPRKSQNLLFFRLLKSSEHQRLPCLFYSRFLQMFRTTSIFGMSRDHNRKRLKTRTDLVDRFLNITIRFAKTRHYLQLVVCI